MVSLEFKSAVADKNLLRTRIMLKDSLVLDPTFVQFNEMFSYAKMNLPNLMENYDGDYLEEDSSKWTSEIMNEELVHLVTNFSDIRIIHLKKVVSKVLAKEAEAIKRKSIHSNFGSDISRGERRKSACRKMRTEAIKVDKVLHEVNKNKNRWKTKNIDDLEQAAKRILRAVNEYRENG